MRTGRPARGERVRHRVRLRVDDIADVAPAHEADARRLRHRLVDDGPATGGGHPYDRREDLARAVHEELELTVLVERPERGDRARPLALLAEAFGPQLHVPVREAGEAVGVGHEHDRAHALSLASATAAAAPSAGAKSLARLAASIASTTARAPARMA